MKDYLKALRHYADFSGRATRREYWMFILFNIIFGFAAALLGLIVALIAHPDYDLLYRVFALQFVRLYQFAVIIPLLAITVRRLHDSGKSGWWALLFLPASVNIAVNELLPAEHELIAITSLITIVCSITLLVFMLLKGNENANPYGENPQTARTVYSRRAQKKSLALTLILAQPMVIIFSLIPFIQGIFPLSVLVQHIAWVNLLMLVAGILFLQTADKNKAVGIILLIAALICFVSSIIISAIVNYGVNFYGIVYLLRSIMMTVALALAGIFLLQISKEQKTSTISAKLISVCIVIVALLLILEIMLSSVIYMDLSLSLPFYIIPAAAFLVLAAYLRRQEDIAESSLEYGDNAQTSTAQAQQPRQQQSLGWKIFGLFVSIFFIIGGFSGDLVLRGTESSTALIVVGFILFFADLYSIITHKKKKEN